MIINDLNIGRASRRPAKADTQLVIDADAVLAGSVAMQQFQPIARWHAKVLQPAGDLQLPKLAPGDGFANRFTRWPPAKASVSASLNEAITDE